MSQPPLLNAAPIAGFDEPFAMLAACHERIARTLALLQRLATHLQAHGADAEARPAARDVMRYFDVAGPAHHVDEERHVFPTLFALGEPELDALVEQLQADHREMTRQWAAVRADLAEVAAGRAAPADAVPRWTAFAALYDVHMKAEDEQAYPRALPHFDADGLQAMGREMAARRGAVPPESFGRELPPRRAG